MDSAAMDEDLAAGEDMVVDSVAMEAGAVDSEAMEAGVADSEAGVEDSTDKRYSLVI